MQEDLSRAVADAVLRDDETWVVYRAVRDPTGAIVDFRIVHANTTAVDDLRLGPLVGEHMLELAPQIATTLFPAYVEVIEDQHPRRLLTPAVVGEDHPSWRPGWTSIEARASGDVLILHWRDATQEHDNAHAARASEARLRALVENAGDVVSILTGDGQPQYVSPSAPRILGRPDLGPHVTAHVHPEDAQQVTAALAQVGSGGDGAEARIEVRFRHGDGRWLWTELHLVHRMADEAVNGVVAHWRDVSEQRALSERLREQALHDPLTRLPNRRVIATELERALARTTRSDSQLAVLFCDVDHFKSVNDALGHLAGDELLMLLAERLRSITRPGDCVGRVGGDEFVVVCESLDDPVEQAALAARVHDTLSDTYQLGDRRVPVTVTVGASVGRHPQTANELLGQADTALYAAKNAGRNCWRLFDQHLHRRNRERLGMEEGLRRALIEDELRLVYQPIVEVGTGELIGAEALLRWQHPTQGLLGPASFLPIAEESGLIVQIGAWVLLEATRAAARWPGDGNGPAVNVNLSGRQLSHPEMLQQLDHALEVSGIRPHRLRLELTETVLLQDLPTTEGVLAAAKARGVTLALDDFGTGYSSLTWLQRLPVDCVKLDGSFIGGLGTSGAADSIVSAVVNLAHTLGKTVAAEAVETAEQHDTLVRLGCDLAQGHLYGRPAAGTPHADARPQHPA